MSFSTDLAAGFARGGVQPPAEGLERAGNHTPLEIELSLLFFSNPFKSKMQSRHSRFRTAAALYWPKSQSEDSLKYSRVRTE
jgi:hypothetical protein